MRLFTYCIPVDDGAAPNPYFGVCTLAICKPKIRSVAQVGDWVVGLGSKNVYGVDYSGKVVYAMKVTKKMTMMAYDEYCKQELKNKIPDVTHSAYMRKVGDCIYDFSKPRENMLRPSVHNKYNVDTDLGGHHVLLSDHFYYFGDSAIDLPTNLRPIIHQGQGHKSNANNQYKEAFVFWIGSLKNPINTLLGNPQIRLNFSDSENVEGCAAIRCATAKEDWIIDKSC
ncbi:hypothetical protein J8L88_05765 [Aquimarina sp. MMG015]|uniref:Nmad2 family putative nucleotide modification protein n=1 Tax=Aquimarina sp. MMG015 TaxID=2822689 RepID=UPI001B39EFFE|nr:hypothetical protein [Aquimarina sp. MMG015]MBQ4802357.1 hypothetical protein [Aquimarina sp. MMG015]